MFYLQHAIKKMPLNAQNVKLLTSEIHIMKESTHENIVRYYESFRVEDKLWVAMVLTINEREQRAENRESVTKSLTLTISLGVVTLGSRGRE